MASVERGAEHPHLDRGSPLQEEQALRHERRLSRSTTRRCSVSRTRADLRDLIHGYALGLDTRDWDLWRSAFTDEVIIDTSDYEPEPPPRRLPVDVYVSFVSRLFAGLRGDAASDRQRTASRSTAIARRSPRTSAPSTGRRSAQGGDRYTMFGTYVDECERTPDGWRISSVKLHLLRQEGNREVMRRAESAGETARLALALT